MFPDDPALSALQVQLESINQVAKRSLRPRACVLPRAPLKSSRLAQTKRAFLCLVQTANVRVSRFVPAFTPQDA